MEGVRRLDGIQTVRLDRPGLVGTPWPGRLPRLAEEVATLTALIRQVGRPMVVVAHSMAGLHAEALARCQPSLVAGLVLVDSSVEWSPAPPRLLWRWLWVARVVRALLLFPPLRPMGSFADRMLASAQSRRALLRPTSKLAKAVYRDREATASVIAEQGAYAQQVIDLAELRRIRPFPQLQVVVLTAPQGEGSEWLADQARLAALLVGGRSWWRTPGTWS